MLKIVSNYQNHPSSCTSIEFSWHALDTLAQTKEFKEFMTDTLACLILAAGQSKRFGSCKLTARLRNKAVIDYVIQSVLAIENCDVYLCSGAYQSDIINHVGVNKVTHIRNDYWQQGIGKSISMSIVKMTSLKNYDGIMIVYANQYRLTTEDLAKLIMAYDGVRTVCAYYCYENGVPAIFSPHYYEQLKQLDGDMGLHKMLNIESNHCYAVEVSNAQYLINTKNDLSNAQYDIASKQGSNLMMY